MTTKTNVALPAIRAKSPSFLTNTRFDDFNLPKELLSALDSVGFLRCTPIQARSLQVSLSGQDVAGQAQTGTGKTAAFLVTIFSRLLHQPKTQNDLASALIVAPTRELARQIYEEAMLLGQDTNFELALIVGGVDYAKQAQMLRKGMDIVICTPGRIIDYMKQNIFKTDGIKIVVIDEADRLLDLGFAKDMRYILRNLPPYTKRQSMLFSATLSYRVLELTYEFMNLPEFIDIAPDEVAVEGIEQQLFHVGKDKKINLLLGLLKRETWSRMLIFVNTKIGVEWLAKKLRGNGWPAEGITGDLPQVKRFKLMEQFKEGKIKILIATDVASRGIHVEDISHVINYDLPQDAENYVHRIGRTARAGHTGHALSLACETYVFHLEAMQEYLKYKIPVVWPEKDWYAEDKAGPVTLNHPEKRKNKKPVHKKNTPTRPASKKNSSRRNTSVKRPPGYFPGTFFGFGLALQIKIETHSAAETKPEPLKIPKVALPTSQRMRQLMRKRKRVPFRDAPKKLPCKRKASPSIPAASVVPAAKT